MCSLHQKQKEAKQNQEMELKCQISALIEHACPIKVVYWDISNIHLQLNI